MAKKPTKGSFKAQALLIDMKPTSYNTRFRANALHQVSQTINERGLPLLLVHDSSKLPVGAWYEAEVKDEAVYTKFFIPKEVAEYEDIKTRIEADILDSVSIGFNADKHDCSICGNDIQNYEECPHIPGHEYDISDPIDGTSLGSQCCYVMLDDVKASEGSLVYSGAVPAAKIVDSSDKAEFFAANKLNFSKGSLEIVHGGEFLQDHNVNNNPEGEDDMTKEEYEALKLKHQELTTKFGETNDKYTEAREANIELKEQNFALKEKADAHDAAVTAKEAGDTKYSETVAALAEKVSALAAPFKADYEAPSDIDTLLADLDKYMEEAKALPSGQQHITEDELEYSPSDDTFKV